MLHISDLHRQAQIRLANTSENPKKLALLHTAIALGSSFLLTVVSYLFSLQISDTGGLGGLGARSLLETSQAVLEFAVMIALPIWQVGIYYAALQWTKGDHPNFTDLFYGFRRFRSALGVLFLRSLLFIILGMALFYVSIIIFMLTPFSAPMLELMTPIAENGATPEQMEALLTPENIETVTSASVPLFINFIIVYAIVAIPLFYRLRFADFAVVDDHTAGKALVKSFAITRRSCRRVFLLELSFWWFYLLQMLSVAICYADFLLPLVGISLPMSDTVAAFVFYAIGSVCQCALLWQFEAKRVTTYALAYRVLDGTLGEEGTDEQT